MRIEDSTKLYDVYTFAYDMIQKSIERGISITQYEIKKAIKFSSEEIYKLQISSDDINLICRRIETEITLVEKSSSSSLVDQYTLEHSDWVEKEKNNIIWNHWNAYRNMLLKTKPIQMEKVSIDTTKILSFIENPKREAPWSIRGLVVGDVQAGKTSNYIGLITKAVDAGYKIVIVLAGITNDLRKQTQIRIDNGLIGINTDKQACLGQPQTRIKGVAIDNKTTSADNGDYKKAAFYSNNFLLENNCALYVVKKNVSILKNIYYDIKANVDNKSGKVPYPLLLIDDEADNASINTKQARYDSILNKEIAEIETDVSSINKYIRGILTLFDRSTYVGYTATPYANILGIPNLGAKTKLPINEKDKNSEEILVGEDLFPRNFIYYIEPLGNYYGPERVFGLSDFYTEGLPVIVEIDKAFPRDLQECLATIDDNDITRKRKKIKKVLVRMPNSLKYAIDCFFISGACKQIRNTDTKHNTMLIHIERLTENHNEIYSWVCEYINSIKKLFIIARREKRQAYLNHLFKIWNNEYKHKYSVFKSLVDDDFLSPIKWETVIEKIPGFIASVECSIVNGQVKKSAVDYDKYPNGKNVIAIGGDKLSRGLTLSGLTISYFLRPSKMFDSLSQMGRWFGYRDGYIDLCRIFTTSQIIKSFSEISKANYNLKLQFQDLSRQPNKSPKDYGLHIISSPESRMLVTALNKQRNSYKRKINYSKSSIATAYIPIDDELIKKNCDIIKTFIKELGLPQKINKGYNALYWRNVPSDIVISNFFDSGYELGSIQSISFSMKSVKEYIEKLNIENKEITDWTVVIPSGGKGKEINLFPEFGYDYTINISQRTAIINDTYYELNQRALLSEGYEAFDLTDDEYEKALKLTNEARVAKGKECVKKPSPLNIRKCRSKKKALLILYFLEIINADGKVLDDKVPAFLVSFPDTLNNDASVIFICNKVDIDEFYRLRDEEQNEWEQ